MPMPRHIMQILKRCESLASEVVQPHSVQVLKKRRRVSFAPDGELETMHTYEVMVGLP